MFCGSGGLRGEDLLWPRLDQSNYSCSSQLNSNGLLISSFIRIYVHANYRASSQLCLLIVIEGMQFHKFLCIYSVREKIYKLSENIGGKVERKKDWLS